MDKTFTQLATDYTTLSRDASAENLALGKSLMNTFIKKVLVARDWVFNRSSYTDASVADQQAYPKPYNCERIRSIKVTADTINYFPEEVKSRKQWNSLNRTTTPTSSDAVVKYFIDEDQVEFWPIPASDGNDIKFYFQKLIKDLSVADYAVGTITTSPAYSTAIVSTSPLTAWTVAMIGRHLVPTDDGYAYEIESVETASALTVKREVRLKLANSAYNIAEMIPLPFGFEDLPLWFALGVYFQSKEGQITQAREYERMAREGLEQLLRRDAKSTNSILTRSDLADVGGLVDINRFPDLIS